MKYYKLTSNTSVIDILFIVPLCIGKLGWCSFWKLCKVILVFEGQPGMWCSECAEWHQEWNAREHRVCAGAGRSARGVIPEAARASSRRQMREGLGRESGLGVGGCYRALFLSLPSWPHRTRCFSNSTRKRTDVSLPFECNSILVKNLSEDIQRFCSFLKSNLK